jgi:MoaA/NifB/PqqE/SkfB family radical SAM enzyme
MAGSLIPGLDSQNTSAGDGFFPIEHDGEGPFCWTHLRFTLRHPPGQRYLALELGRPDSANRLTAAGSRSRTARIAEGWHWYSFDVGAGKREELELNVDGPLSGSENSHGDGVMLRTVSWHNSSQRHSLIERARANAILNEEEYRSGAVVMRSVPPFFRLTIEVRCNIANEKACVYCAWKWMKNEEVGSPTSDLSFIKSLDSYLSVAKMVSDSSYGEPPLHPEFAQIVSLIASDQRAFSFASNGKTMRRKVRQALLGRNVLLYISIDSATSAGYARYRDHSFDRIIADLRALCREKKLHVNLPHVTVSFIVMNSNKHEIRDFLALMHSIGVDRVKLMSLGREDCMELDGRVQQRGAFVFNYDQEIVPLAELEMIGQEAQDAADEMGVNLYVDWRDFRANHGPVGKRPLCSEPWKSLYVLNRGIFPCCFGRKPLARWTDRGSRPVEQFIEEIRNGAAFQEIRRSLGSGVFPAYCLSTHSCPIVRKAVNESARSASEVGGKAAALLNEIQLTLPRER